VGKDSWGKSWSLTLPIKSGGCWLWTADLDKNGKPDFILMTSDATSFGDSVVTLLMIDDRGRPVPWWASGHFEAGDDGLVNLMDFDHDKNADLVYLHVE